MQLVDAGMLAFAGWHALKGKVEWPLTFQVPRMLRSTLRDAGDGDADTGGEPGSPGDTYVLCWNAERLRKRELWPEYRDRPEIWEEADGEDFRLMLRVLSALGAVQYRADGWEADEVLAALVHRLEGDEELVIRSDDKDFMQLLSGTTRMEGRRRGTVRHTDVEDELGVAPDHVADLLALAGDRADGIPRIVPPSTARELIEAHGHVRDWIDRVDGSLREADGTADSGEADGEEAGGEADDDGRAASGEAGDDAGGAGDDRPVASGPMDEDLRATLRENRDQLLLNLELVDLSEEAVGAPPDPMLDAWGDLETAREIGERTGIGWLTDDDLADEYSLLRTWGERTRELLGV